MIDYLENVPSEIELICEEHPIETYRVRNTNIVALHKNSNFIASVLEKIKKKLETEKDAFGHKKVFDIGSYCYIKEFLENTNHCIYKYPYQNTYMLTFDNIIYSKNTIKWQNTDEYIFKKSAV